VAEGRIVVAEDSALLRAVAHGTLTEHGYEVELAVDGLEALETIRTYRPDVVLCDVTMPRLDGFGVLDAMRADAELAEVPVVFLTSRTRSDQAAEGLRRGAYDYLRKPFDAIELIARMQSAVRTKRLQDELKERHAELRRLASTDSLTGLPNRRRAEEALSAAVAAAGETGIAATVVLLDVDHFKKVNDIHGHDGGDDVLVEVAKRLGSVVEEGETAARWGGEEFLLVVPPRDVPRPVHLADAAHEVIRADPFELSGAAARITASVGWAAWAGPHDDPGSMLRRADVALYAAKESGRDRVAGPTRSERAKAA
jgi:two-component system, cell cycle response regulator